ncbi:MAG TPA: HNH endonuclease [Hanamia sp.]|nr:HNH endonuclease [Hanamia sp.]
METSISQEILLIHLLHFSHSLKCYPEKYIPLIFQDNITPPLHHAYVCPLCLKKAIIVDQTGLYMTAEFSLDHFPPESSGGKLKILVCKKCNNEAGTLYDYSIKQKLQYISFDRKIPSSSLTAKSEITNVKGWYHSNLNVREDGEIEISFKPNPKKKFPLLDSWIDKSKDDLNWKANLTFRTPDDEKVSKALLKAAYLYCFINWGYEFVYSAHGELIRNVLSDSAKYPITVPSFWLDNDVKREETFTIPIGLCFIQRPMAWQSFVINLPLTSKDTGYNCTVSILIPNSTEKGIEDLIKIQKLLDSKPECEVSFVPLKNFLEEKIYDGYTKTWESVKKEFG